jgi:hypothetical protein
MKGGVRFWYIRAIGNLGFVVSPDKSANCRRKIRLDVDTLIDCVPLALCDKAGVLSSRSPI